MPDRERRSKMTPVPTDTLTSLVKSLVNVETRLGVLMDDVVPDLAEATKEARDGMIDLRVSNRDVVRRLDKLESATPPPHLCEQVDTIQEHGNRLESHTTEIEGFQRWRWWLMGAAITIGLFAAGLAGSALVSQGEALQDRTGLRRDVERHEDSLVALSKARVEDRDAILQAVSQVPRKVQKAALEAPTLDAVSDGLDRLPLKNYEVRQIRALLERAGRRKTNGQ